MKMFKVSLVLIYLGLLLACDGRVNIILDTDMVSTEFTQNVFEMIDQFLRILMLMMLELYARLTDWSSWERPRYSPWVSQVQELILKAMIKVSGYTRMLTTT